jgi:hypothetical protein
MRLTLRLTGTRLSKMSAAALTVNGVLRRVSGGAPIPMGFSLYYGLAAQFQLILLANHSAEKDELQHWLELEGLNDHAMIIYPDSVAASTEMPQRRLSQVTFARSQRYELSMTIDPDPAVTRALFENGYTTMTFSHQDYSLPEWRPDYNLTPHSIDDNGIMKDQLATPWDDLQAQVAHNAYLRAQDKRTEHQDAQ